MSKERAYHSKDLLGHDVPHPIGGLGCTKCDYDKQTVTSKLKFNETFVKYGKSTELELDAAFADHLNGHLDFPCDECRAFEELLKIKYEEWRHQLKERRETVKKADNRFVALSNDGGSTKLMPIDDIERLASHSVQEHNEIAEKTVGGVCLICHRQKFNDTVGMVADRAEVAPGWLHDQVEHEQMKANDPDGWCISCVSLKALAQRGRERKTPDELIEVTSFGDSSRRFSSRNELARQQNIKDNAKKVLLSGSAQYFLSLIQTPNDLAIAKTEICYHMNEKFYTMHPEYNEDEVCDECDLHPCVCSSNLETCMECDEEPSNCLCDDEFEKDREDIPQAPHDIHDHRKYERYNDCPDCERGSPIMRHLQCDECKEWEAAEVKRKAEYEKLDKRVNEIINKARK